MQIKLVNINFGARIPETEATKTISSVLNFAQNYDYGPKHSDYKGLCNNINKLLPKNSDEVIFNVCDNQYGSSYYTEGEIIRDDEKKSFDSCVYYRSGSNTIAKDILSSIQKALIK